MAAWETLMFPPVEFEVKLGTEPVHNKSFPVPHMHMQTLYKSYTVDGSPGYTRKGVM